MNDSSSFSQKDAPLEEENAQQLIAEGSTCCTYRVRLYGKLHTKKQLCPQYANDESYRALLDKEFEIGYQLDYPTLPRYISKGEDKDGPYLLMEYIDGMPLDEFLTTSPEYFRKDSNCRHFAQQLLKTVEYLHARQILHLDIKPQNILITRIGHELRLLDFGFAYADAFDTTTGHSPAFAAPEQLRGERPYDQRTDLYSIGKVMELVYGKETAITKRLTQPQPSQRFASATEALSALDRKSPFRWILPILLLMLLVASVFWLSRPHRMDVETPTTATPQTIGYPQKTDSIKKIVAAPQKAEKISSDEQSPATPKQTAAQPPKVQKEEPWKTEVRKMVDDEFNAFYASFTELTEENYTTIQAAYQAAVVRLLDSPPDICKKYPDASEQEVSAFVYHELDRVTPAYRSRVSRLWGYINPSTGKSTKQTE